MQFVLNVLFEMRSSAVRNWLFRRNNVLKRGHGPAELSNGEEQGRLCPLLGGDKCPMRSLPHLPSPSLSPFPFLLPPLPVPPLYLRLRISTQALLSYMFTFAICHRPPVCLSVTFVHPTQAIEIFGNVSTPFGTLAIC